MLKKLIKYIIYLIVFLVPLFWLPFSLEAFDFNKGYLLFVLTSVGVLLWLGQMVFKEKKLRIKTSLIDPFILAFLAIAIVSSIFSVDKASSFFGFYGRFWPSLFGIITLGFFYFLFANNVTLQNKGNEANLKGVLKTFFISCFIITAFSYLAVFGLLGKIPGLPRVMTLTNFNMMGGSLEGLAMFLVAVNILLVALIAMRDKESFSMSSIFLHVLFFLNLGLLMLVNFRSAWIALIVGLLLFLGFSFWKRVFKERVNRLSLSIFLLLIAVLFLVFSPLRALFPSDSFLNNLPSEIILTQRASWDLSLEAVKESPVLGVGPSNFSYIFSKFKPEGFLQSPFWQLRFDRAGSHLAEILASLGILGLLSYAGLIIAFLLVSYLVISSFRKSEQGEMRIMALPFFLGFIAMILIQVFYYENAVLGFLFWFFLALGAVSWGTARKERGFSFNDFPEVGLIFSIAFWVVLIGVLFSFFTFGKYYVADASYRNYLLNPTERIASLEKSVRLAPQRTVYHIVLSRAYLDELREEVLSDSPDNQTVANLVSLAVREAKTAVQRSPKRVSSYEAAGVVYREIQGIAQGASDWAKKSFEDALALEPQNPVLMTELGKLYLASEDEIKAREYFERAVSIRPDYIDAQLQLAFMEDREGRIEEAQDRLESLVELSPFSVEARFQLGRLYFNDKEYNRAKAQLESALTLFPNHSNSLYALALVYEKQGQKDEALALLRKVLELNPGNQDVEEKIEKIESGVLDIEPQEVIEEEGVELEQEFISP